MSEQKSLIQVILFGKLATENEVQLWQTKAKQCKQLLFAWIAQHESLSPKTLAKACAHYFQKPHITVDQVNKSEVIDNTRLVLQAQINNQNYLLIANPDDLKIDEKIKRLIEKNITIAFSPYDELYRLFNKTCSQALKDNIKNNVDSLIPLSVMQGILSDAIHRNASDIHFEPYSDTSRIRIRIDGLLHHQFTLPKDFMNATASCIKVMSKLDIAIKRIPQDGRVTIQSHLGFIRDARISTYPTMHGEKIVIRLLDTDTQLRQIDELGLLPNALQQLRKAIQKPQGLILITGPTGSGKTITLYTLLQILNKTERNISTIEDPIEIELPGINQSQTNTKLDFHFSQALRALLRQDPDILMVGEIRDQETAQIAVRAAQTGHLVLSTLHTNNVLETMNRLATLGVNDFHISDTISLIVAQRLVRRLCAYCKMARPINESFQSVIDVADHDKTIFEANGCTHCTNGYRGRIGVFDIFDPKKNTLSHNKNALWQVGLSHVFNGITSLSEIIRVIYNDQES